MTSSDLGPPPPPEKRLVCPPPELVLEDEYPLPDTWLESAKRAKIPNWIDEGLAYAVSHGGRFRGGLAFRSLLPPDRVLLRTGAGYALKGTGQSVARHLLED